MTAAASALDDSYCSPAWGAKLGQAPDAAIAAGLLNGSDTGLTDQEKAMATWARKAAQGPQRDHARRYPGAPRFRPRRRQIFAITSFVALRLAFSTINDSLGAQPDAQLALSLPQQVREAVTYGRPIASRAPVHALARTGAEQHRRHPIPQTTAIIKPGPVRDSC